MIGKIIHVTSKNLIIKSNRKHGYENYNPKCTTKSIKTFWFIPQNYYNW